MTTSPSSPSPQDLPEPAHWQSHEDATGTEVGPPTPWYSAEQMRAARQEAVPADPELTSLEVNEACWAWLNAMPNGSGAHDGCIFNNLKPAIHAAICRFLAELRDPAYPSAPPVQQAPAVGAWHVPDIADAYLVEWRRDDQTWVHAHASYSPAADQAKRTGGTVVDVYKLSSLGVAAPPAQQAAAVESEADRVIDELTDLRRVLGTDEWDGADGWCEAIEAMRHELTERIARVRADAARTAQADGKGGAA